MVAAMTLWTFWVVSEDMTTMASHGPLSIKGMKAKSTMLLSTQRDFLALKSYTRLNIGNPPRYHGRAARLKAPTRQAIRSRPQAPGLL